MENPFVCDAGVEKPGIIGSRWWNKALRESTSLHTRRSSFSGCLIVGGLIAIGGVTAIALASSGSSSGSSSDPPPEEVREEKRRAIDLQRDYGWSFGSVTETVAFDTQYTQAYARDALAKLEEDLAPSNGRHRPFYVPTLFQSPEAVPRQTLPDGETEKVVRLAEALRPINTPTMIDYEKRGKAYAELISQADGKVVTFVDLPGPEAVAFAAGAAQRLDPVFLFDNWPHPRGVVASHLTLAAAVFHQPTFSKAKTARSANAWPIIVLDRNRLAKYTDDATQFDNRYLAKVTAALALTSDRVLYIVPKEQDVPEQEDLNAVFAAWHVAGSDVRALAAEALQVTPEGARFGANADQHASFFAHYPWKKPAPATHPVSGNALAAAYKPAVRPTAAATVDPATIGLAAVVIGVGTGVILGSKLNRSGTWNRTYSNYGGG